MSQLGQEVQRDTYDFKVELGIDSPSTDLTLQTSHSRNPGLVDDRLAPLQ
jgi:hypothetical protein